MAVGKQNIVFYEDDGVIMVRNPIWVKKALAVLLLMFDRVGI